jgi:hypothetical protein
MERKWKRGDVREDGMVFYRYQATARNGEYWMSPEMFATRVTRDQGIQVAAQGRYRGDFSRRERRNAHMREWRKKNAD